MGFLVSGVQRCICMAAHQQHKTAAWTTSNQFHLVAFSLAASGTLHVLLAMLCHMVYHTWRVTSAPSWQLMQIALPGLHSRGLTGCGVQKGSLDGALRGIAPPGEGLPKLHWHLRIRLAAACADALSYLHSQPPQVGLFAYMWPFHVSAIWGWHLRQLFDKQICLSKLQAKGTLYGRFQCILC